MKRLLLTLLIATTLSCGFQGCAKAIVAKSNKSKAASFDPQDKGKPTSGIVAVVYKDGWVYGRKITSHMRDRYNGLIELYGDQFVPPLKQDEGIDFSGEGDTCVIRQAEYVKLGQMIGWKRNGKKPTGTFQKLIKKVTG